MVYLDYNATTPVLKDIVHEIEQYFLYEFGNAGSRTHEYGLRAHQAVEKARDRISKTINCLPGEVIFTSGATESNNLVILGMSHHGRECGKTHIISTVIEHKSVLKPLHELSGTGFNIDLLPVDSTGRINPNDIPGKLSNKTLLVSIMQVNNETGVIQPVTEIAEMLKGYPDIYFHVDAAQGFGKINEQLQHPRIDFISISGHKLYAPKGVGVLIVRKRNNKKPPLKPLMFGGDQEGGLRPGTLPVPLVAGLGKASEMAYKKSHLWNELNLKTRETALKVLSSVPYDINGDLSYTVPHVLNISFPGINSEALFVALKGIAAISNGSACTSHTYKPSHVLKAMGFSDERISSSVRISWGITTKAIPWDDIIDTMKRLK